MALSDAVASGDLDALCLVPGVGKKTAARLLVELKSRLDIPGLDTAAVAGRDGGGGLAGSPQSDVRDALANLGYGPEEIGEVLRELPEGGDSSTLLKAALQRLAV
jgi:Holliday junction DNA helicase RuvA